MTSGTVNTHMHIYKDFLPMCVRVCITDTIPALLCLLLMCRHMQTAQISLYVPQLGIKSCKSDALEKPKSNIQTPHTSGCDKSTTPTRQQLSSVENKLCLFQFAHHWENPKKTKVKNGKKYVRSTLAENRTNKG